MLKIIMKNFDRLVYKKKFRIDYINIIFSDATFFSKYDDEINSKINMVNLLIMVWCIGLV